MKNKPYILKKAQEKKKTDEREKLLTDHIEIIKQESQQISQLDTDAKLVTNTNQTQEESLEYVIENHIPFSGIINQLPPQISEQV
jgi:5-methylthioribose kinase